jgi:hypothetical protein
LPRGDGWFEEVDVVEAGNAQRAVGWHLGLADSSFDKSAGEFVFGMKRGGRDNGEELRDSKNRQQRHDQHRDDHQNRRQQSNGPHHSSSFAFHC